MSSANSLFLKWSKSYSLLKIIFLYYNIYIRNLKFFFKKSQSQFGEDIKIARLFPNGKKGTYLDLGCFHPIRQNNTYLLHKLGWSGINIDLNPLSIDLFNVARPYDKNICAAVSNRNSTKTLYFDHSLSSVNTISKRHLFFLKRALGLKKFKKKKIRTINFSTLLKKNRIKKIDFMNIDIEDSELDVLKTINFKNIDIKVICIEVINQFHTKDSKKNKDRIINLLRKNNYILSFKTYVNYIFIKRD